MKLTQEDQEYYQKYILKMEKLFSDKNMAIILCHNKETDKTETVLCSLQEKENGHFDLYPFARLFGNKDTKAPLEYLEPISPEGDVGAVIIASQTDIDVEEKEEIHIPTDPKNLN